MGFLDTMSVDSLSGKRKDPPAASTGSSSPAKKGGGKGGGGGGNKGDKPSGAKKLLLKGTKTALAGLRTLEADVRETIRHEKDSMEAKQYKKAMAAFNEKKPKEKGVGHPWGAPRNIVIATMAGLACGKFAGTPDIHKMAETAFGGREVVQTTLGAIAKMLEKTNKDGPIIWSGLTTFARAREARNGDVIVSYSPHKGRFLKPAAKDTGMLGAQCEYVIELLAFPWCDDHLDGPAPRGTLERQMERPLRGLSIDDEDDDADI